MINTKLKIKTKDNQNVRIVSTDGSGDYPLIGYIGNNEKPHAWTLDGKIDKRNGVDTLNDIRNVFPKKKAYVNIYRSGGGNVYTSKEKADKFTKGRVACVELEYEDGDGLFDRFIVKAGK